MDFTSLLATIKKLQAFKAVDVVPVIIDEQSDGLVQAMRDQLIEGKDKEGMPRQDEYRPFTKAYKRMFGIGPGAIIDHVTFYMTGTLSQSLYYSRSGDLFTIKSDLDTYMKMLSRIGADEYGIDPEKRLFFARQNVLPEFKTIFKQRTGLVI